jgi:4-hydroxy-3-polyprenylbenzoate decarboxylase
MARTDKPRLIVGISGASGIQLGLRALDACRELGVESHLVMSRSSGLTLAQETELSPADVQGRADVTHKVGDVGAAIASGSFQTLGMIVAPCSVRTMSEIATGVTASLLTRAADVTLKERRPLVLVHRETPLSLIDIENYRTLTLAGAIVCPANPGFYLNPRRVEDLVDFMAGKVLDLLKVEHGLSTRWADQSAPAEELRRDS